MRLLLASILLAPVLCLAQGEQPKKDLSLFLRVRPQITMLIQEHQTGAEDVTIGAVDPKYPAELLKEQVEKLGQYLGVPPRWLYLQPKAGTMTAAFSINGLIDREKGVYRLQPIVRAFAGAPEPFTVTGMQIIFAKERGGANDLATYAIPGVLELEVMRTFNPDMLEYRVHLLSQDPEKLVIPEKHTPKPQEPVETKSEPSRTLFYVLLVVAGLAASVLVYLALLRLPSRTGS